jgi:pimeloyl-ACP methyl ester carboxylesterase
LTTHLAEENRPEHGAAGDVVGPASSFYLSQRLRLHYVDWGNRSATPLILVHGGRDHARSWDAVGAALRRDHHVIAPDLRGHGDSSWAIGSIYHFIEYVIDLAQLIEAIGAPQVRLIGHSLGAFVCAHYTGTFPDRVEKFVAIEGIDAPASVETRLKPLRIYEQIERMTADAQRQARRAPRRYATLEAAVERMREENPRLSSSMSRHLTEHGMARNEDGTYSWKFDDYARGPKPLRFSREETAELVRRITCPTLLIRGTESDTPDPKDSGLLARFRNARSVAIEGAGHWVHHDQLAEFLEHTRAFLAES